MGIIDIGYIEIVSGITIQPEEEPTVQKYIDIVSRYIERVTGRSFSVREDAVIKALADGKGIIEIPDLQEVTTVEFLDAATGTYSDVTVGIPFAFNSGYYGYGPGYYGYSFDGISQIYGLNPRHSYKVTCTYGQEAPEEIKGIVADLVLAGTGLDQTASNGLVSKRVGDVEEMYGVTKAGEVTLDSLQTAIMNEYSTGNTTYRT